MKTALLTFCIFTMLFASGTTSKGQIQRGVSFELATQRKAAISNLRYDLFLELQKADPIPSAVTIQFDLAQSDTPLVLDFNAPKDNVQTVSLNGEPVDYKIESGHIVIPASKLSDGKQIVKIDFVAGDQSLNRNEKFLYTLLVPDRASTVFPCFDQPDLKAKFGLKLTLPAGWIASGNGAIESEEVIDERTHVQFATTKPISTYLFAFAAGEFKRVTREVEGRTMTMLHRETDEATIERNIDDIFAIHALSLDWMEEYTGIEYPFAKFDFVLIPSFQYGGMEHIGNIFYNANSLFLAQSATKDQKLGRASLIAHETAHMWFGNLVTMKWFDDVWLKEVFANFMAAKIVHPSFPTINHDLGFMLKHHPSAYGEDRTGGTYPIQQELDNLKNAGTLYGRIIYQKAPIVMRQLETMIGAGELKNGLRKYLTEFRFDNAVWDDLIDILDAKSDIDLKQWSAAWVKEAGTPEVESLLSNTATKKNVLVLKQTRKTPNEKFWSQQVDVKVFAEGKAVFETRAMIDGESTEIAIPESLSDYDFYLANGSELGYGYFRLDEKSKTWLTANIHTIEDDVTRGAAWLALYETLIRGELEAGQFLNALTLGLKTETEPLNRQNLLGQMETVFWKFLPPSARTKVAPEIEATLWSWVDAEIDNDARSAYYKSLLKVALTEKSLDRLGEIFDSQSGVNGMELAEADYMTLAFELAIRKPTESATILNTQLERLVNEDRKNRFAFVMPALSAEQSVRDEFFVSLKKLENRRPERWALDGVTYLHHPLRAAESEKYILPSLELLEEIQTTGDIFFPKRWLVATFSGHRNKAAAETVTQFLEARPDYSFRLKNKILQAADLLLKVAE
jgi:aminopeptidase N